MPAPATFKPQAEKYQPFELQKNAHKALLVDGYLRALLYWSRRCFTADALVMLASGVQVPISEVRPGMWVVSYNEQLGIAEPKEVLELHCYGVDQDPKPMVQFKVNGQTITSTYDHEYYSDGCWVPAYQLAWGAMAPRQRQKLKLLCQQYGQAFDDPASWRIQDGGNEASTRRFWVLKDGDGRQNHKSPSGSRANLAPEPLKQASDQPHRQQSNEQSDRKLGVGDESRERSTYDESGAANTQRRGEVWHPYPERDPGIRDTKVPNDASSDEQTSDVEISSLFVPDKVGVDSPYFEGQDLEIGQIEILPTTTTYDLTVADNHNYVVYNLLVHNTGKTLWSVQQLVLSGMLRQGPYHIVFKEYQQAETVAWGQYLHTIPKSLVAKTDKSTLTVTFNYINGTIKFPPPIGEVTVTADYSKPPTTIRLLGSDKSDAHRGGESMGMIFDEYQDQDSYGWDFVYKYFLATTNGWAVFMGTAKDEDEWNELIDAAQVSDRWYFSKATWRENPLIKPDWIAVEREEAERNGRLGAFLQETELIPFSQQGAVYPMFNKDIHVIRPDDVPTGGTTYIALDFGFAEGHPMACNFIDIVAKTDTWYQWDEIHEIGMQLDDLIAEIRVRLGERHLTTIVADSARPDLIEYLQSKGLPVIPSPKKQNSIVSGIQLHSRRLQPKIQIMGEPKPNFYITSNCKRTIYDYVHYRYKDVKKDRHPQEIPEKKFDDSPDANRYLELWLKFGLQSGKEILESSALKELHDYGL